jgi:hypothetical protein
MPRRLGPLEEFTADEIRDMADYQPAIVRQSALARARLRWHRDHLERILKVSPTGVAAIDVRGRVVAAKAELDRLQLEIL